MTHQQSVTQFNFLPRLVLTTHQTAYTVDWGCLEACAIVRPSPWKVGKLGTSTAAVPCTNPYNPHPYLHLHARSDLVPAVVVGACCPRRAAFARHRVPPLSPRVVSSAGVITKQHISCAFPHVLRRVLPHRLLRTPRPPSTAGTTAHTCTVRQQSPDGSG